MGSARVRDVLERTMTTLWVGVVVVTLAIAAIGFVTMVVFETVAGPPEDAPIVGLYREDGVVFAAMSTCDGDQVVSFVVDDPRFAPGERYEIWVRTQAHETSWTFGTDQLDETDAGTVLTSGADAQVVLMPLPQFQERTRAYCA